jgi:hypothetical protein
MGDVATDAGGLPRLDIFDHEFQREPPTVAREHQRTIGRRLLVGCLLGAAIISLPALAWLNSDALPESAPSAPMILQSASSEPPDEVARLALEIAMLKRDLDGLAHAHQRAVEQIATLEADQQSRNSPPLSFWYSDLSALSFESAGQPRSSSSMPPGRRATVRSEMREMRRRESAEPLSLEAPQ